MGDPIGSEDRDAVRCVLRQASEALLALAQLLCGLFALSDIPGEELYRRFAPVEDRHSGHLDIDHASVEANDLLLRQR